MNLPEKICLRNYKMWKIRALNVEQVCVVLGIILSCISTSTSILAIPKTKVDVIASSRDAGEPVNLEQMKKRLLEEIRKEPSFKIVSGTPEIVYINQVTVEELTNLGIFSKGQGTNLGGRPLILSVFKGNFTIGPGALRGPLDQPQGDGKISRIRTARRDTVPKVSYKYVSYVFDVKSDAPILKLSSINGGRFSKVLGNPNLKDPPPTAKQLAPFRGTRKAVPTRSLPKPLPKSQ
jgi:hypothetical protein